MGHAPEQQPGSTFSDRCASGLAPRLTKRTGAWAKHWNTGHPQAGPVTDTPRTNVCACLSNARARRRIWRRRLTADRLLPTTCWKVLL